MNNLQLGIILGLSALLFSGLANSLVKIPSKAFGANKTIFYRNIMNSIILLTVLLFTLNQTTFSPKYIIFTVALSVVGYIPMYFFYRAMAIGRAGVVSPVASSSALVTTLLAIIFVGDRLLPLQLFSIAVIIFGIILISIKVRQFHASDIFKVSSGIPYALVAAVGWGIWAILAQISSKNLGPFLTAFIIEFIAIFVALFLIKKNGETLSIGNKKAFYYIIPMSIFMCIESLVYYQGIKISNVSIVATLTSASPLVVVIFGYLVYKERLSIKQYLAIAMIIGGIALLTLA